MEVQKVAGFWREITFSPFCDTFVADMKLITPEIVWHNKEPVLSVHFHRNGPLWRLVTGGADNDVKMWKVTVEGEKLRMVFVSSLSRHTKSVNVVRFSPNGELLASAGDDSIVYLWKLSDGTTSTGGNLISSETASNKENWSIVKVLRGHLEDIYDVCWSPDSNFMISGSVDNTAIVWDVQKGQQLTTLKEPRQYVQGVAWDPLGKYVATLSCDRNLRIYTIGAKFKCVHTVSKLTMQDQDGDTKHFKMWMDESLSSFFRRLTFTPDGSFLITPGGTFEVGDKAKNSTYVFARNNLTKPVLQLPGPEKPTVCVRCSPLLYELLSQPEDTPSLTSLPYRMVYAVASIDSVLLYDTQHTAPFAFVSNIHYAAITDMAWSNDGQTLVITSSDCYCSILTFEPNELGTPLPADKLPPSLNKRMQLPTPIESRDQKKQDDKQKSPNKQAPSVSHNGEHKGSTDSASDSFPPKVALSTLPSPAKESVNNWSGYSSPENKPRRIRPTTIETFTSPKQATTEGSPSPSSTNTPHNKSLLDSDLQPRDTVNISSPPQAISNTSTGHRSVQNTSSIEQESRNGTSSPLSSAKNVQSNAGPRRVKFITLSSFSSSQSSTNTPKGSETACTVNSTKPTVDLPQVNTIPSEQNVKCDKKRNDEETMEV